MDPGAEVEIADAIYGLESFEVYYFRLVAENATARAFGETRAFRTLDTPPAGAPDLPRASVVGRAGTTQAS